MTSSITIQFILFLSLFGFLFVNALPVFDADLAANPFVHDARMNYYERRKAIYV
ncbi:hypothetical protein BDA99DRAFT_564798 [Phascolomyces articulosus]|uniref:Uncharacterized protein n=1 Tax=Phascolomyces articulosus TaxID=60185 RepID=A0AAD5JZW2_9FUNG|nr:hypothetical protein BDA99DRAFT_564798 [Phascolomyces articulosus]